MATIVAFSALFVIPADDRSWKVMVPAELNRSILAMALFVKPPYPRLNILAATGLAIDFLVRSAAFPPLYQDGGTLHQGLPHLAVDVPPDGIQSPPKSPASPPVAGTGLVPRHGNQNRVVNTGFRHNPDHPRIYSAWRFRESSHDRSRPRTPL